MGEWTAIHEDGELEAYIRYVGFIQLRVEKVDRPKGYWLPSVVCNNEYPVPHLFKDLAEAQAETERQARFLLEDALGGLRD